MQQSMCLAYEPTSELLHISVKCFRVKTPSLNSRLERNKEEVGSEEGKEEGWDEKSARCTALLLLHATVRYNGAKCGAEERPAPLHLLPIQSWRVFMINTILVYLRIEIGQSSI